MKTPEVGDYVLATKWHDGDPKDQFCVGFLAGYYRDRFLVVDEKGNQFRTNGFRRAKKISAARGNWIVKNLKLISISYRSLWYWYRAPWKVLKELDGKVI